MPGHDFENKVQQQMEELHLPPSDSVWNRVEQEIRKEKRRRRILFLLPIFLLLGIGGYFGLQKRNAPTAVNTDKKIQNDTKNAVSDPVAVVIPPASGSEQSSGGKDNVASNKSTPDAPATVEKNELVATDKKLNAPAVRNSGLDVNRAVSINEKAAVAERSSRPQNKGKKQKAILAAGITEKPELNQATNAGENAVTSKSDPSLAPVTDTTTTPVAIAPNAIEPTTLDSGVVDKKTMLDSIAPELAKKPTKQAKSWQWGFIAGIGVSKMTEGGLLSAFGQSMMMDAAYNGNNSTPPVSNAVGPSSIEPGLNWNAGAFVQRKINERVQVSAAILYNYFSTQSHIGAKVDSSRVINNFSSSSLRVETYYLNGGNTDFISKYHFIELPVTLHLQLNKSKKTPFYWNSGLSIAQLISTKALHYDGSSRLYYKDDDLFRKTQFGFHTGFTVKLFGQKRHPLELGPHFNYQFTNLLKPKDADARHLLSGSLLLRWYMKK